jgi:hypothetical protein
MMSTSRRKSLDACADALDSLIATSCPQARLPLYTLLFPPFPIRFSATSQERGWCLGDDESCELKPERREIDDQERKKEPAAKWLVES